MKNARQTAILSIIEHNDVDIHFILKEKADYLINSDPQNLIFWESKRPRGYQGNGKTFASVFLCKPQYLFIART